MTVSERDVQSMAQNATYQNLLEAEAKRAYEIWSYRLGGNCPFEQLPVAVISAWKEIVEKLAECPGCSDCGEDLYCAECDAEALLVCAHCDGKLVCAKCGMPARAEEEKAHAAGE